MTRVPFTSIGFLRRFDPGVLATPDGPDPTSLFFGIRAFQQLDDDRALNLLGRVLNSAKCVDGCRSGSWNPSGSWGRTGGRLYMTSLGMLCQLALDRSISGRIFVRTLAR
jgi:hypothetical protein